MQDAAPRLIPSLIEMLNTGYDEICEVQYNLLITNKITKYIIVIVLLGFTGVMRALF